MNALFKNRIVSAGTRKFAEIYQIFVLRCSLFGQVDSSFWLIKTRLLFSEKLLDQARNAWRTMFFRFSQQPDQLFHGFGKTIIPPEHISRDTDPQPPKKQNQTRNGVAPSAIP